MDNTMPTPDYSMPAPAALVIPGSPDFFSMMPRQVWRLRFERKIKPRDVDVLGLLLQFKPKDGSVIETFQQTLADTLLCSLDTIQRSLSRLAAEGVGLIRKITRRGAKGHFDHLHYDLSPTLDLLPVQAAKKQRREEAAGAPRHQASTGASQTGGDSHREGRTSGRGGAAGRESGESSMPQECGCEVESGIVGEANNSDADRSQASEAPSEVVVAFRPFSVGAETARDWETKLGAERCLKAAQTVAGRQRRGGVKDAGGYLIGVLRKLADAAKSLTQQNKSQGKAAAKKPTASAPPRPATPVVPDPLDAMAPEAFQALEKRIRAEMAAAAKGDVRDGYEAGKFAPAVRLKMRERLVKQQSGRQELGDSQGVPLPEAVPSASAIAASLPAVPVKYLSAQDLREEWDALPDEHRRGYRGRAQVEAQAAYAGRTPSPEAVETRAFNLFWTERKSACPKSL